MVKEKEQLLFDHLGESALAFLLAGDVETIRKRFALNGSVSLEENCENVISYLIEIDMELNNLPHESLRPQQWATRLGAQVAPTGPSLGNMFRQLCGGNLTLVPTMVDPLAQILGNLISDIYPGLLVKRSTGAFSNIGLPVLILHHPLNETFGKRVMEDSTLMRLFGEQSDHLGRSGNSLRSTGHGGIHQLEMLASTVIESGWQIALLDSTSPSCEVAIQSTIQALETIRNALVGRSATVEIRVGLTGVLLPEGLASLEIGGAIVRRVEERDALYAGSTPYKGQLQTTSVDGNSISIDYRGDLVLAFSVPYEIRVDKGYFGMAWPEGLLNGPHIVEEQIQSIRLGLVLACPEDRPILVSTWHVVIDPLAQGSVRGWSDPRRTPGLTPVLLSAEQGVEWGLWANRVKENRTASVGVAVRRILMALTERYSPEDVLVDSVIVWENLFGARSETTLRVSSSLAWLLGESAEDRMTRQAHYKKLYRTRSEVVHGSMSVDGPTLHKVSREALQVSIEALRAIFGEHCDLLSFHTSEERSLHILHAG